MEMIFNFLMEKISSGCFKKFRTTKIMLDIM